MVKVKGAQGKRYSPSQKAEIIKFIKEFNAKNKRGGLKAAGDKYGVTVVTLSAWMKKAGKPAAKAAAKPGPKPKAKAGRKRKKRTTATKAAPATAASVDAALKRMTEIRKEIAVLEKEFSGLKKKL